MHDKCMCVLLSPRSSPDGNTALVSDRGTLWPCSAVQKVLRTPVSAGFCDSEFLHQVLGSRKITDF